MKIFFIMLLLAPLIACAQLSDTVQNLAGNWVVTQYFQASETGPSDQVLESYIGQPLIIKETSFSFDKANPTTCNFQSVRILEEDKDAAQYFLSMYRANLSLLPLKLPITIIYSDCNEFFYDKDIRQYIIFDWNGSFFKAVRASNS